MLFGSNWNNSLNAGVSYMNSNNSATNSNRNNGTHLEHMVATMYSTITRATRPNTQRRNCSVLVGNIRTFRAEHIGMKRYGNLFEKIIDKDNLRLAHLNARKGKTHYTDVKKVDADTDKYIDKLHAMLLNHTYRTSPYKTKEISEPKKRLIYKLPYFPDRIVHHAIMNVLQPIWDKTFIHDLYSAIPGKGLHAGSYRLRQFMKDKAGTSYCLKFDISKYYPSINHDILLGMVRRKIKCKDTLWLLEEIIRSPGGNTNVPIGNYLSQYLSNLYLSEFDHWIKEKCRIEYYIRYCDDGVILHSSKAYLKELLVEIRKYLSSIGLTLNPKTKIIDVDRCGIDFLGYIHHRGYTLLRKSSSRNMKDKLKFIVKHSTILDPVYIVSCIMSYAGWLRHCNSFNYRCRHMYTDTIHIIMEHASRKLEIYNPLRTVSQW